MELEVTTAVARPVSVVWDFYAVHHVENHPRWDPDLSLEKTSDGPIGLGTVIRRRNTRYETPTESTMEVVEFDPEHMMRLAIQDGPITTNGWARFTSLAEGRTELTLGAHFPDVDDSMAEKIRPLMERSARTIKDLVESETRDPAMVEPLELPAYLRLSAGPDGES